MEKPEAPRSYQRGKNIFFFVGLFLDVALLGVLFFSGGSFALERFASSLSSNKFFVNLIYLACFSLGFYVIHFPINYFLDFVWEHKFNLSNQNFKNWLMDDLKKNALGLLLFLALFLVVYVFLERAPGTWWLGGGTVWILLSFVLAKLTPNVIIPMFYKYLPIENQALKEKIFKLFAQCNVSLKEVYAVDLSTKTKKVNAFFCGLGNNRRVVLSDTLLSQFSDEEIEIVVAHELGHYKHKDIMKLLLVNALLTFLGLYAVDRILQGALNYYPSLNIDHIAFFPIFLLGLVFFGLVFTPLTNATSRMFERQADRYSIEKTGKPNEFVSMINKIAQLNLAEVDPNIFIEIFLYDHPPIKKRIALALGYLNEKEPTER